MQRMTSLSGVVLSTDAPNNSEPESLDSLDFDDWEGQFEFVGNNNNNNNNNITNNYQQLKHSTSTTTAATVTNELEDLNLSIPQYGPIKNRPILIDEETFLSLQLNDTDSLTYDPEHDHVTNVDGQQYFIENALKQFKFDTDVPSNHTDLLLNHTNDDIIQTKNRLNQHRRSSDNNNNNNLNNNQYDVKMNKNRFSNELCDSLLKEQVSFFFGFSVADEIIFCFVLLLRYCVRPL